MDKKFNILIAYDGSGFADAALDDLVNAGIPKDNVDALIVSVAEVWLPPKENGEEPADEFLTEGMRERYEESVTVLAHAKERAEAAAVRVRSSFPGWNVSAEATYDPPTSPLDKNGQGAPYAVYGYGAQMVELEVDPALGTIRLRKITAAHDVGRAINPMLVRGQIEGGIAQGIGMALMEEYLPARTENLHDYLIPTFGDVPPIDSQLIEVPDPEGPFGAKGLGEHVLIPTAPAILNAIRHATGAEITRVPALPHRVLEATQELSQRASSAVGKGRVP